MKTKKYWSDNEIFEYTIIKNMLYKLPDLFSI